MFSFWNSRNKLALGSLVLVVLLGLFEDEPIDQRNREKPPIDLIEDVDYALETMDYMTGLKTGTSFVRGVVEKEKRIEEWYWSCRSVQPLEIHSLGWIENDGLFLFSAYFDDRPSSLFPKNSAVQVLLMSWRTLENKTDIFCTMNSDRGSAAVKAFVREIWQRAWDPRDLFYVPVLVTCPVPKRLESARKMSVFLSKEPCGREDQALEVVFPEKVEKKKDVAVCVKGMDFQEDIFKELVEWLEAQFLFGSDKITIYLYSLSKRTKTVLDYYEKQGKVEQISLSLPGDSPNLEPVRSAYIWRNRQQKRRHELIPYNDCLYRHLGSHKYILIVDTDEIVVPLKHPTYKEMLDYIDGNSSRKISSIVIRNVFKFSGNETEGSNLFLLRNNKRSKKTSAMGEYGKSFSKIENVVTVFNHFALHRLSSKVAASIHLSEEMAIKLHYKGSCPIESRHECEELQRNTVVDTSLDKHSEELTKRVKRVLTDMGF